MEIRDDGGEYTEVGANKEFDGCSESGEHKGLDNYKPDLEETIPPEQLGYPSSILDYLHIKAEVEKYDYEYERILS